MAQPNYQAYLQTVYPGTSWTVTRLTGGIVNATLRATKTSGDAGPESLVIKHAKPYVEIAGPEASFSTKRQVRAVCIPRHKDVQTNSFASWLKPPS